ncbi:MurR/RpiR family transcriptional regulator [Ligilactobacillus saerimneri]
MNDQNIINVIYSKLAGMRPTDQKIAQVLLEDPARAVDFTISQLARLATVSDASVTRFCKSLALTGFHQLKIELAKAANDQTNYYQQVNADNIQKALASISANKVAEVKNTLAPIATATIEQVLSWIKEARLIQIIAEGDTVPVAIDAAYKLNQLGFLAITADSWETSIAQTLNMSSHDLIIVISNSGEALRLLKQIKEAQKKHIRVLAITNRDDSPIALEANLHLQTAVRQKVFQSEYYFSRIAAATVIEAIFLLLIADDETRREHIKTHEALISDAKI